MPPSDTEAPESGRAPSQGPQEQLPTDRISFDNQMKLLHAYATASNGGQAAVAIEEVASLAQMNASTASLANAFFVKTGLLTRSGRAFLPSREVLDYGNAMAWQPDIAARKLAPIIEKSWFFVALRPRLLMRSISEEEALADLGQRAKVGRDYLPQLRTLLLYLAVSGLVRRDGDRLSLASLPGPAEPSPPAADVSPSRLAAPPPAPNPSADLPGLHPFVQGLLVTLPNPGEVWAEDDRRKWLATAESIFAVIYRAGDST